MDRHLTVAFTFLIGCGGGDDTPMTGQCAAPGDNISLDDAVLDQAAMSASAACRGGRNAASDPYRAEACRMLDLINADRAMFFDETNRAPSVQWNEDLWEVAVAHSRDMCARDFFGHVNPDGKSPQDRARDAGLTYPVGENIVSSSDVDSGHSAFMEEPTCAGHRGQILSPQVINVGIGVTRCDGVGNYVGTQNFQYELSRATSPYCADGAPTACKRPPEIYTSAACTAFCGAAADVDLATWGCDC